MRTNCLEHRGDRPARDNSQATRVPGMVRDMAMSSHPFSARNGAKGKFWKKIYVHSDQIDPTAFHAANGIGAFTKSVNRRML
jgi:hypothetical protein